MRTQKAVAAYFKSRQLLPFVFVWQFKQTEDVVPMLA